MKRFVIIIMLLIGFTSVEVKAQYITQDEYTQTRMKCYQAELKRAMEMEESGRSTFFIGLGIQAAGGGLMLLSNEDTRGLAVLGGLLCTGGTICEIVGISKWCSGAIKIRDLSLAYEMMNGGGRAVIIF